MATWTEKSIQMALCSSRGPVPFDRYICVPNTTSVVVRYTGETDLLAVSPSGYAKEYEIKISVSDLKRDKHKDKHKFWDLPGNVICELWYAMPKAVFEACDVYAHIPEYAGVVTLNEVANGLVNCRTMRKAKRKPDAKKITAEERLAVARLAYLRYWTNEFKVIRQSKEGVQCAGLKS